MVLLQLRCRGTNVCQLMHIRCSCSKSFNAQQVIAGCQALVTQVCKCGFNERRCMQLSDRWVCCGVANMSRARRLARGRWWRRCGSTQSPRSELGLLAFFFVRRRTRLLSSTRVHPQSRHKLPPASAAGRSTVLLHPPASCSFLLQSFAVDHRITCCARCNEVTDC